MRPAACYRRAAQRRFGRLRSSDPLVGSLDLAAPGAALGASRLDQRLEALEIAGDAAVGSADGVAELLEDPFGDVVELDHDARGRVVEAMEGDYAGVVLPVDVAPRDLFIRLLLGDLRVPLVAVPADLGDPVQVGVVGLAHLL